MSPRFVLRPSTRPDLYVCSRCTLRALRISRGGSQRRWVTDVRGAQIAEPDKMWADQAERVRAGKQKSMLTILEERGFVQTITGSRNDVDRMMTEQRVGAYVGIDPTASSLHVGHMIPFMALFWMFVHGYHTVSLVGGATATIGDPTGRLRSRDFEDPATYLSNVTKMEFQLKDLWSNVEVYGKQWGFERDEGWNGRIGNNIKWWKNLAMLEVLQNLGPGMRIGSMLARDTVKNKMSNGDGMSFAEFTYPLMQAWDWWHMFHTNRIHMQIGGSDQFGNITAGLDAIKYLRSYHPDPAIRDQAQSVGEPFGFTVPLLTTSSGQKFGKSAGNAIWLDSAQTSVFDLYKYFLGTADADCEKFLKLFTFMPLTEISGVIEQHTKAPHKRIAQHRLAKEFVTMVHGSEEARSVEMRHRLLFLDTSAYRTELETSAEVVSRVDQVALPLHAVKNPYIGKVFYMAGLVKSIAEGLRLVESGGCYIREPQGNLGLKTWAQVKKARSLNLAKYAEDGRVYLRKGKSTIKMIRVVSDEEYAMSGESYPGIKRSWRHSVLEPMMINVHIRAEDKDRVQKLLDEDKVAMVEEAEQHLEQLAAREEKKRKKMEHKRRQEGDEAVFLMSAALSTPFEKDSHLDSDIEPDDADIDV